MKVSSLAWAKVLSTNAVSQRLPDSSWFAEGREAAVGAPVGELALVAGDQEHLRLGLDLGLELAGAFQVA